MNPVVNLDHLHSLKYDKQKQSLIDVGQTLQGGSSVKNESCRVPFPLLGH